MCNDIYQTDGVEHDRVFEVVLLTRGDKGTMSNQNATSIALNYFFNELRDELGNARAEEWLCSHSFVATTQDDPQPMTPNTRKNPFCPVTYYMQSAYDGHRARPPASCTEMEQTNTPRARRHSKGTLQHLSHVLGKNAGLLFTDAAHTLLDKWNFSNVSAIFSSHSLITRMLTFENFHQH
jgi:hypothetical protein